MVTVETTSMVTTETAELLVWLPWKQLLVWLPWKQLQVWLPWKQLQVWLFVADSTVLYWALLVSTVHVC